MIGDQIELKVLSIDGDQVKLGIVAPKTVKVHRSEVFEAIQEQNKQSMQNVSMELFKNFKQK